MARVLVDLFRFDIQFLWHTDLFEDKYDIYFIPGGFSYGDYLRTGALAKVSRSIISLKQVIKKGKMVVGICNGFQILAEAGILPGTLIKNQSLNHICKWVDLKIVAGSIFEKSELLSMPISHSEGNYICSVDEAKALCDHSQIFLKYNKNPNGSILDIAGISDRKRRVIGLMPHPERACYPTVDVPESQSVYGKLFFEKIFTSV